jgi:AhpD family alkylhydroperoxidase
MERLMLAVTQVNGCALCAWGHTKAALESGMSGEEVRALLGGDLERVPPDEMAAVLFAQHYADTRCRPSPQAWQRIVDLYGAPLAAGILGAVRMIMIGNVYGIAGGAFLGRLRGRPDPHSGLVYELAMIAGAVVVLPVAFFHAGLAALAGKPLIAFTPPLPTAEMS